MALSIDPDAMRPSDRMHTAVTSSSCPTIVALASPVAGSHAMSFLSRPPETTELVAGAYASAVTKDWCPAQTVLHANPTPPMASRHTLTVLSREHVANASSPHTVTPGESFGMLGKAGGRRQRFVRSTVDEGSRSKKIFPGWPRSHQRGAGASRCGFGEASERTSHVVLVALAVGAKLVFAHRVFPVSRVSRI